MPFTLSHPIAVMPLWYGFKKKLPLSALVIGSISPDFPYLIHLNVAHAPGHTLLGLLTHCLPQAFAVFLLWNYWVAQPSLKLIGIEYQPIKKWGLGKITLIGASLILGAITHNIWDSMSHKTGWTVRHFDTLNHTIFNLTVYKWIQYGGGVFGLIAITGWYFLSNPVFEVFKAQWKNILSFLVMLLTITLFFIIISNTLYQNDGLYGKIVRYAVCFVSATLTGLFLYATIIRFRKAD